MNDLEEKELADFMTNDRLLELIGLYVQTEIDNFKEASFSAQGDASEQMMIHNRNIGAVTALEMLTASFNSLPEKHGVKPDARPNPTI